METITKLRESAEEVSICAKDMESTLVQKNGVFMAYLKQWALSIVECTIRQATKLVEQFNAQNADLERIKLYDTASKGQIYIGSQFSHAQMEKLQYAQQRRGWQELSDGLLELFNLQEKYETFPFEHFEEVYEEYKNATLNPVDGLFSCMIDVSKKEIVEFLDICIENDRDGFDFSEHGLIILSGLLDIRTSLDRAFQVFELYTNNIGEFEGIMLASCLDYYDNQIVGNTPREYKRKWKEEPKANMRDSEKSYMKNWISGIAAGVVGVATACVSLVSIPTDDAEKVFLTSLLGAFGGFIVGRIIANIVVRRKEEKMQKNFEEVQAENKREEQRWEAEVKKHFQNKSGDLRYWKDNARTLIQKVKNALDLINVYIQDKFSFMPTKYMFDNFAVATFYDYVRDKRVDNMAQAVNLYVSEQELAAFREQQLANQQEILNAQNILIAENQRKNALLQQQLEKQQEIQRNIIEMTAEAVRLGQLEEQKTEEISKLKERVSEAKDELSNVKDEIKNLNYSL